MKNSVMKRCLSLLFMLILALQLFSVPVNAGSATVWLEAPLNYDEASDVNYVEKGNTVANWGVRGEHATFLTDYAEQYYTDEYAYEQLIANKGSSTLSETPSSPLYRALADMMNSKAAWATSYDQVRDYFKYTDCVLGDYNYLSSFYSGVKLDGDWVTGAWNREHVWPNSKIDNVGENDLMMLRPTSVQENSGRGNTAFGESEGYYDPNAESDGLVNLRGDCARIVLYTYVRWGVTDTMWGSSGVIQSRDILLKWMKEDPVDTWEMGRNDAVQSILGVRNVFVDYPELAWLLFDQEVPADYVTPSSVSPESGHFYTADVTEPTCTEEGYTTYTCSVCNSHFTAEQTKAHGHVDADTNGKCDVCNEKMPDSSVTFRHYPFELEEGDYMIVSEGKALKAATTGANRLSYVEVTEDDSIINKDETIIFHIAKSGDYWTIYNKSTGLYVGSNGERNRAVMKEGVTDYTLWTAVLSEGQFEFVNKKNADANINRYLRCNGTVGFACYGTQTGKPLTLYRNGDFKMPDFTVTWVNEDGTVLETDEHVPYGTLPSYDGAKPVRPTDGKVYRFTGWDKDTSVGVTGDITFTATFGKEYKLYTGELTEGDYVIVSDGKALVASTTVSDRRLDYAPVLEDASIACGNKAAIFHIAPDGDLWTIYNEAAGLYVGGSYSNRAILAESVTEDTVWTSLTENGKYEFVYKYVPSIDTNSLLRCNGSYGWACYSEASNIGGPLSLYRQLPEYTLTWQNEDGTVIMTEKAAEGSIPSYDGPVPTKASDYANNYTFAGWDNDTSAGVTGDTTFTAVYTADARVKYNIFLGGRQITSANEGDVFGDGTVSYDPENAVLTLNNAVIETKVRDDGSDPTVEYGLRFNHITDEQDTLTIKLIGTNRIVNDETAEGISAEYGMRIYQVQTFTVTGGGTLEISMQAENENISYVGINSRQKTDIDGSAVVIDIPGTAKTTGYELSYTNMLTLKNGAALSVTTGSNAETYSMANDRNAANVTVEEGSVLEADSCNRAFNSQFVPTDETIALGASVGRKYGKIIWDGETALSSYPYVRIPCDVPREPAFRTQALLLTGKIGAVFYMYLPEMDGVDYSESYMEFKISGKNGGTQRADYDPAFVNGDGVFYGFICHVNSIQMADTITAVFHYGEGRTIEKEYSITDYLETVAAGNYPEALKNLCAAINDYGYYAQQYLSEYHGWSLGTDHAAMTSAAEITEEDRETAEKEANKCAFSLNTGGASLLKFSYSLVLDSDTAIRMYLAPKPGYEGEIRAYMEDSTENVALRLNSRIYFINITGIEAHRLAEMQKVSVVMDEDFEISISPLSYVNLVLKSMSEPEGLKDAVTALYKYYAATIEYIEAMSS